MDSHAQVRALLQEDGAVARMGERISDGSHLIRILPDALMIGAQRSISLNNMRCAASGVARSWDIGSVLISWERLTRSGSLSAPLSAAESLSTMAGGVPLGANTPCQTPSSKPFRPASSAVGTSGSEASRALVVTA